MLPRSYFGEHDMRKWQIDTLKIFNDHVTEIIENAEYRVDFVAAGMNMSLDVILPPDFPNEKPGIFINPLVCHPWIAQNSNQVIGAPGLLNFTIHSDLGRVVQAIIRELQKSIQITNINHLQTLESTSQQHTIPNLMFPELYELSNEELEEMLENTDLQDKLLENNRHLMELDLQTEEVMTNIEQIAKENLSKKQKLDDLKTEVIDRISTIVQLKMNFEDLNRRHQQLASRFEPHKLRECLKEAASKADEESEEIAEQFLLGQLPVDVFVSKYAEKRALGLSRRAREERLAHQLAQLELATS